MLILLAIHANIISLNLANITLKPGLYFTITEVSLCFYPQSVVSAPSLPWPSLTVLVCYSPPYSLLLLGISAGEHSSLTTDYRWKLSSLLFSLLTCKTMLSNKTMKQIRCRILPSSAKTHSSTIELLATTNHQWAKRANLVPDRCNGVIFFSEFFKLI